MRSSSPSAQAVVFFVGILHPALAYLNGIVIRHLLVTLITGGEAAHTPLLSYEFS
jgi:hypothetical protein